MKKYRSDLIWAALVIAGGVASTCVWIAVTGTFRPAWWWIVIGSVLIGVAGHFAERAITRRLDRPERDRHRAHAR